MDFANIRRTDGVRGMHHKSMLQYIMCPRPASIHGLRESAQRPGARRGYRCGGNCDRESELEGSASRRDGLGEQGFSLYSITASPIPLTFGR